MLMVLVSMLLLAYRTARDLTVQFLHYLYKPTNPYNLAVYRILFGCMMLMDLPEERGLAAALERWGDPQECRFPLLSNLKPLQLEYMCLLYFVMLIGIFGIIFGAYFRLSCLMFGLPYWYLFLLEKSRWNNHSYLYGLLALQFFFSHANYCWSVDGIRNPKIRFAYIPRWNYLLARGQIFILYFVAGIKKLEADWIQGYSMDYLAAHWIFYPFRFFLSDANVDLIVVHWGGFFLDLTVGFFLFYDKSRPLALFFSTVFHLMNSQIFAIGMFAYLMLTTGPLFCSYDWPHKLISSTTFLGDPWKRALLYDGPPKQSQACLYTKTGPKSPCLKPVSSTKSSQKSSPSSSSSAVDVSHAATGFLLCSYFALQFWLPFSHSWTPGFNTWTDGPYGYSWDMMVHSWKHVHTRLTLLDAKSGKVMFLDPNAWTSNWRWTHQADMVKQLGECVARRMRENHNMTDVALFVDIWLSVNGRVAQRVYDPTVDVLKAPWSPFRPVDWVLPLLTDMAGWRERLRQAHEQAADDAFSDVLFMADFPGYSLVNFIDPDLSDVYLSVLQGNVEVYTPEISNLTVLKEGQETKVASGMFHRVSPVGHKPSCYYYRYVNATMRELEEQSESLVGTKGGYAITTKRLANFLTWKVQEETKTNVSFAGMYRRFAENRMNAWINSTQVLFKTFHWFVFGTPMVSSPAASTKNPSQQRTSTCPTCDHTFWI